MQHQQLKLAPYLTEDRIRSRITEIAGELNTRFDKKTLTCICVLKGSFMFYSDLIRQLKMNVECEFFGVSSYYGGTTSSGEVKVTLDLTHAIEGKHVLLVEDIVDTGLTMNYIKKNLNSRGPESLTTVALLSKPDALKVPCEVDHIGFQIPNDFVVGYGLDYQGHYRNLPYIAQVQNFQ